MLTGTFSTVHVSYLVIQIMINVTLLLLVFRPINRILTLNVTNSSTNTERVMKLVAESLWSTRDIKLFRLQTLLYGAMVIFILLHNLHLPYALIGIQNLELK